MDSDSYTAHAATNKFRSTGEKARNVQQPNRRKNAGPATNVTQGTKSAANQTGEKMQAGGTNATQGIKSERIKQGKQDNLS